MKKYQELESKIAELQKEVDRLKEEEEEKQNELPDGFTRDFCIKFLENFDCCDLNRSFTWRDTPQGEEYWSEINVNIYCEHDYEVPQDAIIYIQGLIIKSYQQGFGSK